MPIISKNIIFSGDNINSKPVIKSGLIKECVELNKTTINR
jgi:hypothetical protein